MNIAIIPARAGSKSIINKNLQKIGTRSLVERTINSAIGAGLFDKVILTTDIPVLLAEYDNHPSVTVRRRDMALATDTAAMADVVLDCINHFGIPPSSLCWLLQPTSPFRAKTDYVNISRMFGGDTRSVISVVSVESHHPNRMYTEKNKQMYPLRFTSFSNKQNLPKVYLRSGHFYVMSAKDFVATKSFYIKPCRPYEIDRSRGVNIDDPIDLLTAKALFEKGLCK